MTAAEIYEIFDPSSVRDGAVIAVTGTIEFPLWIETIAAEVLVPAGNAPVRRRAVAYVPSTHVTARGHTQLIRSTEHEDKYL